MRELNYDLAIIGAGPAGLSAAVAAKKQGAGKIIIIERDLTPGGILQQCIHAGFGLGVFKEELTGPEFAGRFLKMAKDAGVEFMFDSMALSLPEEGGVICSCPGEGMCHVKAKAVILSMGCRERTRFNLRIPGTRPAGVYTAGTAQRLINRQNEVVGKKIVILGSGDIGMIMARRMTLEGAKVEAVVEIMGYLAGLTRNKVQCLDDFGVPLLMEHTVTRIEGERRVEGVWIAKVDENKKPIKETERFIECDTLLLSVGLIPENELTRAAGIAMDQITGGPVIDQYMQTSRRGIFACGNVVHVCDLADNVAKESMIAGSAAARYVMGELPENTCDAKCTAGEGVSYVCPQHVAVSEEKCPAVLRFRVKRPMGETVLKISCEDKILRKLTVPQIGPGQMQQFEIDAMGLGGKEILVSAVEVG